MALLTQWHFLIPLYPQQKRHYQPSGQICFEEITNLLHKEKHEGRILWGIWFSSLEYLNLKSQDFITMKGTWNSLRTAQPVDLEALLAIGIHYQSTVKMLPLSILNISIVLTDESLWKVKKSN